MMTKRLLAAAIGVALVMSCVTAEAKQRSKRGYHKASYSHQHRSHVRHATIRGYQRHVARGGASASRSCLTSAARALLARIESQFGAVQVVSTCRPGAVIAGSGRPSLHRYGMAFDFRARNKAAVVRWLVANNSGGTMTYAHSDHIHADVGPRFASLSGSRRTRVASASRGRSHHIRHVRHVRYHAPNAASHGHSAL
jgi:uncharacterized protein YcbK (DUF882 family)